MYYTIYQITNLVDGKVYVGCHKTDNLDDGYMGSGKYLKRAIKKYGIENFRKDIIGVFDTPEEMFYMESVLVNEEFVDRTDTYNIKMGGHGGFDLCNKNIDNKEYIRRSKVGARSIKEKIENDPELREKYRLIGVELAKKYAINFSNSPRFTGKTHTEETKKRIGEANSKYIGEKNSQYGTMWITNEVESKKINKDEEIPEGWRKGRKIK